MFCTGAGVYAVLAWLGCALVVMQVAAIGYSLLGIISTAANIVEGQHCNVAAQSRLACWSMAVV